MPSTIAKLGLMAFCALPVAAASRAQACVPGCGGYHLTFTGPTAADGSGLAVADHSVTVTWQDSADGPTATLDILASADPVPAYPMHAFPAQLPGQVLALELSATSQSSWTWNTAAVPAGTYYLYAVFHNSPFNTLVMPFAAVTVVHGQPATPALLLRSPRGTSAVAGSVALGINAWAGTPGSTVDVYAGSPPDAADGTPIATGVPAASAQSVTWDSSAAPAGSHVFKAVLRGASGEVLATAFSPGIVETSPPSASCSTGGNALAPIALAFLMGLGVRGRQRRRVSR